ncbi:MAG: PilN domain-containing protein [Thermodesulfobacteriota bacterium]
MIRINLIPEPERKEVKGIGEIFIGICVLVALFVAIAAIHILQGNKIDDVNRKIARAEKRIKELEVVKKKVDDFKAKNAELKRRIEIINVLEKNRTGPLYVMDALSRAMPNKAWIDEFTEKGGQTKLVGVADNEFTVADFMQALQTSPYFVGVELGVIKKTELRKLDLRTFVINTKLDYAGKSRTQDKTQAPKTPGQNSEPKKAVTE